MKVRALHDEMIADVAIRHRRAAVGLQHCRHQAEPWTKYRPIPDILTRCGDAQHVKTVVPQTVLVHGISGLRVADGSVMPSIPSANTAATVYAIAERAAELIGG